MIYHYACSHGYDQPRRLACPPMFASNRRCLAAIPPLADPTRSCSGRVLHDGTPRTVAQGGTGVRGDRGPPADRRDGGVAGRPARALPADRPPGLDRRHDRPPSTAAWASATWPRRSSSRNWPGSAARWAPWSRRPSSASPRSCTSATQTQKATWLPADRRRRLPADHRGHRGAAPAATCWAWRPPPCATATTTSSTAARSSSATATSVTCTAWSSAPARAPRDCRRSWSRPTGPASRSAPHRAAMGLHGFSFGELIFDNCRVPAANRLGAEGDGLPSPTPRASCTAGPNLTAVVARHPPGPGRGDVGLRDRAAPVRQAARTSCRRSS